MKMRADPRSRSKFAGAELRSPQEAPPGAGSQDERERADRVGCGPIEPPQRYDTPPVTHTSAENAAEHRQVTVMFIGLFDSTPSSAHVSLLKEAISAYQQRIVEVMRFYDGFVLKNLNDGVLACFGYPMVQEDQAERAGTRWDAGDPGCGRNHGARFAANACRHRNWNSGRRRLHWIIWIGK
jgi:class 3 adenylate cyclase